MKIMRHSIIFFAVAMTLLLVSSPASGGDTFLKLKFNEGDVFTYKFVSHQTSEAMGMKGSEEEIRYVTQKVVSIDDGIATMEMKIDRVVLHSDNPMTGKVSFDSAETEEEGGESHPSNEMFAFYEMMLNQPFKVKMDTMGHVVEVEGFSPIGETMVNKMLEDAGDTNPQMQLQADAMKSMYSDKAMCEALDRMSGVLPDEAVAAGKEWEETNVITIPMAGDLVTTLKRQFEGVTDAVARIALSGTLEFKPAEVEEGQEGAEADPMAAMRKMMKLTDSKIEGFVEIDTDSGHLKKSTQTIDFTISVMGQNIPQHKVESIELIEFKAG